MTHHRGRSGIVRLVGVEMAAGRRVAVVPFDGANPDEAMVVGVY